MLPDGARLSPDACWVDLRKVASLDSDAVQRYWRLCPDFVVELRSHLLREKMEVWIASGAELAWLIDPFQQSVTIHRTGAAGPEVRQGISQIEGERPVAGFVLNLDEIWNV